MVYSHDFGICIEKLYDVIGRKRSALRKCFVVFNREALPQPSFWAHRSVAKSACLLNFFPGEFP